MIEITKPTSEKVTEKTLKWNYKKANWELYRMKITERFNEIDPTNDLDTSYQNLADAIIKSAKETIPRGNRKRYRPYWDTDLEKLVNERKKARRKAEKHPSADNRKRYNYLTAKVKLKTKETKRSTWKDYCSKLDLRKDGKKAWTLLTNLSGKRRKVNPTPLKTPDGEVNNASKAD